MKEIVNEYMKDTLRNVKVILNMGITDEEKINKLKPLVSFLECGSMEGRGRINKHMKNTLRDIKIIFNKRIINMEKIKQLKFTIALLESVECGSIVTSDFIYESI